jgi:hypothetical protein
MEIHAPTHPITTWRQTLAHLAIITAGVLIALMLEGMVSWIDHRLLVHEATANLTAELRDNEKELDGLFANLDKERHQLEHADEIAKVLLAHEPIEKLELAFEVHGAELKNAALTTSEVTGALGYMDYGEVRRYASIYDLQAQFMRLQERQGQHFFDVVAFVRRIADTDRPTDEDVRRWRSAIDLALADVVDREQIGRQLQKRYAEFLTAP